MNNRNHLSDDNLDDLEGLEESSLRQIALGLSVDYLFQEEDLPSELPITLLSPSKFEWDRLFKPTPLIDFDMALWPPCNRYREFGIKKEKSSTDDFGSTLRGTQLDGYFNRTSTKPTHCAFFKTENYKKESNKEELETVVSEFYKLVK